MGINNWIKLEVIPDSKYLLPDPIATFEAAQVLVHEGFTVLPYINLILSWQKIRRNRMCYCYAFALQLAQGRE